MSKTKQIEVDSLLRWINSAYLPESKVYQSVSRGLCKLSFYELDQLKVMLSTLGISKK
jgi:hypothetical protein